MFARFFDNSCANDKITSLGPNRLVEKKHFKKRLFFTVTKVFKPSFTLIIECDKPQKTICEGPQASLTITADLTIAFLQVLRGC